MTFDAVCPRHGTPNRELVLHTMLLERPTYTCDTCEAEIDQFIWNHALDELGRVVERKPPANEGLGEVARIPIVLRKESS